MTLINGLSTQFQGSYFDKALLGFKPRRPFQPRHSTILTPYAGFVYQRILQTTSAFVRHRRLHTTMAEENARPQRTRKRKMPFGEDFDPRPVMVSNLWTLFVCFHFFKLR
jgi:hypothetical protein